MEKQARDAADKSYWIQARKEKNRVLGEGEEEGRREARQQRRLSQGGVGVQ